MGVILRHVHHEVDFVIANELDGIRYAFLNRVARTEHRECVDSVLVEVLAGTCGGIYLYALLVKLYACSEDVGLLDSVSS